MSGSSCRLCGETTNHVFTATVLNRYEEAFYRCSRCELLQPDDPHWLGKSNIQQVGLKDTGRLRRCLETSRRVAVLLWWLFGTGDRFLDFGGGHGLFTRRMRDLGFDFYWYDAYAENLFAHGFTHQPTSTGPYRLATAIEVFEHVPEPLSLVRDILGEIGASNLLFTTRLYGQKTPDLDWWYYQFSTGQHVAFYNVTTLRWMANRLDLNLYSDRRSVHLLTERDLSAPFLRMLLRWGHRLFPLVRPFTGSRTESDFNRLSETVDDAR